MNIFIAFVLIIAAVYFTITFAKKGVSGVVREIKEGWAEGMAKSASHTKKTTGDGMQVISLTIGTCDSCGAKFIGTTADESSDELKRIEFLGETKVICKSCLNKILEVYNPEEKTDSVTTSSGIDDIIGLVTKSKN